MVAQQKKNKIPELELAQIQGIILSGYSRLNHSAYLFLNFGDTEKDRKWLSTIKDEIAYSTRVPDGKSQPAVNIAFTASGLKALGLEDSELKKFAPEFVKGMAHASRSRILGDVGTSAPSHWEFGNGRIDLLLMIFAACVDQRDKLSNQYMAQAQSFGLTPAACPQKGDRRSDQKEHFGFKDGISQPAIEGLYGKPKRNQDVVKAGEFILGYKNEYDNFPPSPTIASDSGKGENLDSLRGFTNLKDIGRNGSYLVFRKLSQNVAAFREYFERNFQGQADLMAAKCVGRWPNGDSLTLFPDQPGPNGQANNNFSYFETDREGYNCPIGSHVRRTNPRDSLGSGGSTAARMVNRHRILRRGVTYGPEWSKEETNDNMKDRGLFFICLNADIERQFEFIQQTWVNNPKFAGLYNDSDPILGNRQVRSRDMTIQRKPIRTRLANLPDFVTVKGGGYFFVPGKKTLEFLSSNTPPRDQEKTESKPRTSTETKTPIPVS